MKTYGLTLQERKELSAEYGNFDERPLYPEQIFWTWNEWKPIEEEVAEKVRLWKENRKEHKCSQ